jgi:hypothetical protein
MKRYRKKEAREKKEEKPSPTDTHFSSFINLPKNIGRLLIGQEALKVARGGF